MNQPDLLQALLAASFVDGLHKNDKDYKPLLPGAENPLDPPATSDDQSDDPWKNR
jgi:hypothetical protein